MKEIPVGSDVAAVESSVKNKWRWAWLTEDEDGDIFGTWCKKTDQLLKNLRSVLTAYTVNRCFRFK